VGFLINKLIYILILAGIFLALSKLYPSVRIKGFGAAMTIALIYSVLNFFLGGILGILFKTFTVFIFFIAWFFTSLVVNGVLLAITDKIIDQFEMKDIKAVAVTSLVITGSGIVLSQIFK